MVKLCLILGFCPWLCNFLLSYFSTAYFSFALCRPGALVHRMVLLGL